MVYGPRVSRQRRRRRRRFTPDSPLVLDAQVPVTAHAPARWRWLSRPLAALAGALPSYPLGRAGRPRAIAIRLAIGGVALLVAMEGRGDLAIGAVAAAIGLTLVIIPLPEHRKRRWIAAAESLARPRAVLSRAPATVRWDGEKLVVTSAERVWRSLRPYASPTRVSVARDDARVAIALQPRARGAASRPSAGICFECLGAPPVDTFEPLEPTPGLDPPPSSEAIRVDREGLADLHEAFWDAGTEALPRRRGAADA